jgi:hypothetical protein
MSYCANCGNQVSETDHFCPHCGTPRQPSNSVPIPVAPNIPPGWEKTFALIEKAGGPSLPRFRELTYWERMRIRFNFWAFIFGPLYYVTKGMWKKAITRFFMAYAAASITVLVYQALGFKPSAETLWVLIQAWIIYLSVFSHYANVDYYRKVVLGDNGWL